MRVFVLNTGRCGSVTFSRACSHLTNYSAGHETLARNLGHARFAFPDQHIETDNRLAWFLGEIELRFGAHPFYVHLIRDPDLVVDSFYRRWNSEYAAAIIKAFANGMVMKSTTWPEEDRRRICQFYVDTVTANIEAFLRNKPRAMTIHLEHAKDRFPQFWERIGAEGDLSAATAEFDHRHNAG